MTAGRRSRWPARSSTFASTARAAPGSASCCRTPRGSSTTSASSSRCTPRRSTTTRRSPFFQTGSQQRRPAEHGRVAHLRPRQRQRGPAGVRRADSRRAARSTSRSTRRLLGQRLPADAAPGRAVPRRQGPGAVPVQPDGIDATRRRRMLDDAARAQPQQPRGTGDPEIDARIAQYEMAYRMQASVPELTDLSKEPDGDVRALRPGRRASPARSPPTACWPAGWPSAACGSSSSITSGWDQHGNLPRASARQCRGRRPGQRRAGQGPEAARPARRHAGHLGRRVRPHQSTRRAS